MKKAIVSVISVGMIFSMLFSGCASKNSASSSSAAKETRIFTDSVGREVEVPKDIKSVAPSGPLAQIVLYTAAPDKLAGIASDFSDDAKQYIDQKYWSLPKFGQFYGKNASLNMEALEAAAPDVIIDIGETKDSEKGDMDNLQSQLGIPTVFIAATLDTMDSAYTMLGDLLGNTDRASLLADYCKKTVANADAIAKTITDDKKVKVYEATGTDGLSTNAAGSIHADVIPRIGAANVVDVQTTSSGSGTKVSLEQIMKWNPDVILVDSQALYTTVTTDSSWKQLNAVKNGKVYRIPSVPYSIIGNPPSINRMIGIDWLGNLLYPDQYKLDTKTEIKNFYKLFYSIDLTDDQYNKIVG